MADVMTPATTTTSTMTPATATTDFMAAAIPPPRYRVVFTDGTSQEARTQDELVGLVNQRNQAVVANRQMIRSAIRGATAPWFLRNLAAIHVRSIDRL